MKRIVGLLIIVVMIGMTSSVYAVGGYTHAAESVILTEYQAYAYPKYAEYGGIGKDLWDILGTLLKEDSVSVAPVSVLPYRPLKRILLDLKYNKIQVFALLAYTPVRTTYLQYSSIPVYITSSVFVMRKGEDFVYNGPFSLKGKSIGVVAGTRTARYLKKLVEGVSGVTVYEVSGVDSLLRMVARGRLDLGFYSALSLKYLVYSQYKDVLDIAPGVVDRYGHYIVYSHGVDIKTKTSIDEALFYVVRTGMLDNVLYRYNVMPETVSLKQFYMGIPSRLCSEKTMVEDLLMHLGLDPHVSCYGDELSWYLSSGVIFAMWTDSPPRQEHYITFKDRYIVCSPAIYGMCTFLKKVIGDEG